MKKLPYPLKNRLSSPEEIENMEAKYASAKPLRKLILQVLDAETETTLSHADSQKLFEDPNWAYRSAYLAGYRQALRFTTKLIKE